MSTRADILSRLDWRASGGPRCCVYCGSRAVVGVDHVPPVSGAVVMIETPRWAYPCCKVCNRVLGQYPKPCLKDRAAFLLDRLRVRWLAAASGRRSRVPVDVIAATGKAVRSRLEHGETAARCRCGCENASPESMGLAKNPDCG